MAIERTFSIIKPDATARNLTGAVNAVIEKAGLRIVAQKRIRMTRDQAETFYAVHKARPFFGELVDFMTSGPVVVQVLEGEGADRQVSRRDGRDRSVQGGRRHHPQAPRKVDRRELGARFGCAGDRGDRDRAVLLGQRDRRLIDGRVDKLRPQQTVEAEGTCCELALADLRSRYDRRILHPVPRSRWPNRPSGSRSARSSGSTSCLSGDNALVIALACRGLEPQHRLWGMIFGAGAAVLLRIIFTGIVATPDGAAVPQAGRRPGADL